MVIVYYYLLKVSYNVEKLVINDKDKALNHNNLNNHNYSDMKNKLKDYMSDPEKELIKELNNKKLKELKVEKNNNTSNNNNNNYNDINEINTENNNIKSNCNNDVISKFCKFIEESNNTGNN